MSELLTKHEAEAVANFIEKYLLEAIVNNNIYSPFSWLKNVINAYDKLREYGNSVR